MRPNGRAGSNGRAPTNRPVDSRDYGDKSTAYVAAYYLSRFDHLRLGMGNQGETIKRLSRELGVKPNTLKNLRDTFDSHTGSHREGWKTPLNPAQQEILERFRGDDETVVRTQLLSLLKTHSSP